MIIEVAGSRGINVVRVLTPLLTPHVHTPCSDPMLTLHACLHPYRRTALHTHAVLIKHPRQQGPLCSQQRHVLYNPIVVKQREEEQVPDGLPHPADGPDHVVRHHPADYCGDGGQLRGGVAVTSPGLQEVRAWSAERPRLLADL